MKKIFNVSPWITVITGVLVTIVLFCAIYIPLAIHHTREYNRENAKIVTYNGIVTAISGRTVYLDDGLQSFTLNTPAQFVIGDKYQIVINGNGGLISAVIEQ